MKPACGSAKLALVSLISSCIPAFLPSASASGISDPVKVWVVLKDKGPAADAAIPGSARSPIIADPASVASNPVAAPVWAASRAYEDLPVYAPYLEALRAYGFSPDARLKWQNRVSGYVRTDRLAGLRGLPFVTGVSEMPRKAPKSRTLPLPTLPRLWKTGAGGPEGRGQGASGGSPIDTIEYGEGRSLIDSLRVDKVHAWMIALGMPPGKGIRVAFVDADFHLGSPIFKAMKSRIRDQWDFVDKKPGSVTDSVLNSHGAECMSLIGGNLPGTLVGAAPEADFLLYRAEENEQERYVEEDYVAAAIERAVDSGAQVISISLGYRYDYSDGSPDLPYAAFNGRERPSSIAATGAARRNVVVSVSMGNDGLKTGLGDQPSLSAPADADSILAVGIVDRKRVHCAYSSTGPSADGRVKPDVVSMGGFDFCTVAVAGTDTEQPAVDHFAGTSFAAPAVAGIAVLLRQLRPDLSAAEIRQALITTADRYASPDGKVGHGLVDATAAAKRIGIPLDPVLVQSGLSRLYHTGGLDPILLDWEPGKPAPALQLLDLSGRQIAIAVTPVGARLFVQPQHPLQTGIYIARVR